MTRNTYLRDAILARGLDYDDVADRVRVDPKTVRRWVRTGRLPRPRYRRAVAELLNVPASGLWPTAAIHYLPTVEPHPEDVAMHAEIFAAGYRLGLEHGQRWRPTNGTNGNDR